MTFKKNIFTYRKTTYHIIVSGIGMFSCWWCNSMANCPPTRLSLHRRWPNLLMSCAHHLTMASVCGGLSCFSGWQAQPPTIWRLSNPCSTDDIIHTVSHKVLSLKNWTIQFPTQEEVPRDFSAWLDHQDLPLWGAALLGATSESSPLNAILIESYFIVFNLKECVITRAFSLIYLLVTQALLSAVFLYHSNNILNLYF